MKNGERSAFAKSGTYNPNNGNHNGDDEYGFTKREYLAALAMQGLTSNPDWARTMRTPDDWDEYIKRLSSGSVEIADALLKELEKTNKS